LHGLVYYRSKITKNNQNCSPLEVLTGIFHETNSWSSRIKQQVVALMEKLQGMKIAWMWITKHGSFQYHPHPLLFYRGENQATLVCT